jgi:predicted amidohydrolase
MKVAFIQTSPEFGRVEKNVEKAVKKILTLDCDLVVLPELFNTGYQFKSRIEAFRLSERVPDGYTVERLQEAAKGKDIFIVAGLAERSGSRVYNSAVLVGPEGLVGLYRKAHLFWHEKDFFALGNTPLEVYRTGKARVGIMICFDWLFPEAARTLALKGADIICHPANLVLPHCPEAMITRSIENRVFSITANRVGTEQRIKGERLKYIGQSQVVGPDGKVLYRAAKGKTEAKVVEIDPEKARDKKITARNNILRDRRVELYLLK